MNQIQQTKGYSIQLGETGRVYMSKIDQGEFFEPEEITKMLNEEKFSNKVLVTLFDKNSSIEHRFMPSQKLINRLYKIIYGTHYKIVYRNGPIWELENGY
jgi:hypothetical protein